MLEYLPLCQRMRKMFALILHESQIWCQFKIIKSAISQCHFIVSVSSCLLSRGTSYMALSVVFDMQRTTELRTADYSLENTFQPASGCETANKSWRQVSAISITKSRRLSALMWACTTAQKNNKIIKRFIRRLFCWIIFAENMQCFW